MSAERVDHTTGVTREITYGNTEAASTLLGPVFMMPKAGVIRPGIKVLKKSCTGKDKQIYNSLLEKGATWDEIDRAIGPDDNGKSKLIPSNADYFTIRPEDCRNPGDAKRLHDLYADSDGKIRSLPVWFSVNEWLNIIPHGLRAFGKQQGLRYISEIEEYRNNGTPGFNRICKYPLEIKPGKRVYGGRKYGQRPCDPDNCQEYQSGICNFGGVIRCHIPGVKGIGVWLIPTTSWYSLLNIKSTLEIVAGLTRGRIAGLVDNDPDSPSKIRTVFRIRKTPEEVSMINPRNGKSQRVEQDLIHLDVDMDITMLAVQFNSQRLISSGVDALTLLNGDTRKPISPSDEGKPDKGNCTNGCDLHGVNHSKSSTDKKDLNRKAKDLFDILAGQFTNNDSIKAKLRELTGKESFFELSDEEAEAAVKELNGDKSEKEDFPADTMNRELPEEVKELKNILTSMYGKNGTDAVTKKLKELTAFDSFEKLSKEEANEAIEVLTAASMSEF
jgi:hypothetical protein